MIAHEMVFGAVEQAADAVIITDTAGVIEYVNPAFTQVTGYTSMEALGQVWRGELVDRKNGSLY